MKNLEGCQYSVCCHNDEYQELKKELSQLQQENERLHNSINESNLAKIYALTKAEQLKQDKEELIKYCERLKKELKKYPKENPVELLNTHINIILRKLKESDK